ncbi:MAG: carbohydrate ABC transporter substrate-binding protein, partial [Demequinaceae bacterium]|nr:carbohydrate ABC transporter substrate-binding protein [Demequinaceae bacterium]
MKRRITLPIAAIAVSGLLLAGCSSNDKASDSSTATGGSTDAMPAGCEAYAAYGMHEGESVEVYATIQGQEADDLVTSFADFEKCTGITVNYVGTQEFETQINVRVEGGDAPGLAIFPQPGLLSRIVATGA